MPGPDIGFSTLSGHPYHTAIDVASALDVDFVEITMNDLSADRLADESEKIRRQAGDAGIDLVVHLPHGGADNMLGSSDREVRERSRETFERALDASAEIDAHKAVTHIDASDHRLLLEVDRRGDLVEAVDDLAGYAADRGIELCVENMRGTSRRRLCPDDVAGIARETAAGMTLDTGHARTVQYSDTDTAAFLERHGDVVSHFHLNDTRGASDDHLPFGAGTTAFDQLFEALPAGWAGTLDLEVSVPEYDYIETSVRRLRDVLADVDLGPGPEQ